MNKREAFFREVYRDPACGTIFIIAHATMFIGIVGPCYLNT